MSLPPCAQDSVPGEVACLLPGRELHPLEAPGFAWRTKEACEIDSHHIPMRYELFLDHFYRLGGTPLRAKAVRRILNVGFKKWLDYDFARLLNPPAPPCWHPRGSLPPVGLRARAPPHRLRSVAPRPEVL